MSYLERTRGTDASLDRLDILIADSQRMASYSSLTGRPTFGQALSVDDVVHRLREAAVETLA